MRKLRKGISFILTLVLLVSSISTQAFADSSGSQSKPTITVESKSAVPGQEVNVDVVIQNNPGILGATLELTYDDALTLKNVTAGDAFSYLTMTKPAKYMSPCRFIWDGQECKKEDIKDGTIMTLTFSVSKDVQSGKPLSIGVKILDGDFYDSNLNYVEATTIDGAVTALDYTPGDLNGDHKIDISDVILLRRYIIGGYDVTINEDAANVNDDGKINSADIILLRRYIAGGYGVELKAPTTAKCNHKMEEIAYKAPTCTEEGNTKYWHCTVCDKYFSDAYGNHAIALSDTVIAANGHTVVVDAAVEPTYNKTGLTEGSHCSVCGTVLKKQEVIPALQKNEYAITYNIANNDSYLKGLEINNPNPDVYTSQDGLILEDVTVDGYLFKGWYTAQTGGTKVTEIPAGSTGKKTLYAQWEKIEYTVTFDSPDIPVASVTYTVDKGITLTNPSWFGYTFVGWSQDGEIVSIIKPGTTGNITLHANWTSNRNKATVLEKASDPTIIEDMDDKQYLFVYELGTIENVPLSQIEYIGNSNGINFTKEYTYSQSVDKGYADTIAKTISNATTKTSAWTLSEDWNVTTSATNEHDEQVGKTQERTDSEGHVTGSKYYVGNSAGGSTSYSHNDGGSNNSSSKVTNGSSVGFNNSYTNEKGTSASVNLHADASLSAQMSAGVHAGLSAGGASAGMDRNYTLGGTISAGASSDNTKTDKKANTNAHSRSDTMTDETLNGSESHWDTSNSSTSSWNSTNSYESSASTSRNSEISNTISEVISDKYSYTSTEQKGGSKSTSQSLSDKEETTNEYSSTVEYSTEEQSTVKKTISYSSDVAGYYRLVTAGTVHVFAVVGYDIATNSYFTYTYNILDKERHEYLDYSKNNANFNDCENAILPFEVPYAVHEYISGVIAKSKGLTVNYDTGIVTEYNGSEEYVLIPEYVSTNNGDGTYSAIRIRGISEDAFRGNKVVKGIALPTYVYSIPDNAFEGCSSLEIVRGYGVGEIGKNAFKGDTSLRAFTVDKYVSKLGENAFEDVPEVLFMAANSDIADAAINSGAKRNSLNISNMEGDYNNKNIVMDSSTDYFALISDGTAYENLQIESNAGETFLSNLSFTNNENIPLKLNSEKVTFNRLSVVDSPELSVVLSADNTEVSLYGNIAFNSLSGHTMLSKNVAFKKANDEVAGNLNVKGNYYVCGQLQNEKMLSVSNGEKIYINESQFNNILNGIKVSFDSNGGQLDQTVTLTVKLGTKYGELPVPEKDGYSFLGWYTEKDGGTEVTEDTTVTVYDEQTLYAHWEYKPYTLTFDANGGTVSETSRTLSGSQKAGKLPIPTRDYYDFKGWYTAPDGGNEFTEDAVIGEDTTVYAQWIEHSSSDWVRESDVPSGARVVDTKWTYTQREYTESSNSSIDGYVKYDTRRTGWGPTQGPVEWNPTNGERNVWSEQYVVSSNYKTIYRYFRYSTGEYAKGGSDKATTKYGSNYYEYNLDYELTQTGTQGNYDIGYRYYYNGSTYISVWKNSPFTTSEWVSDNYGTRWYYQDPIYTYYYYRDVNKESGSDPSGQSDVSNVVKYVKYQEK